MQTTLLAILKKAVARQLWKLIVASHKKVKRFVMKVTRLLNIKVEEEPPKDKKQDKKQRRFSFRNIVGGLASHVSTWELDVGISI